ncbi:salicylate hydroxylase [Boeremia exigua]|uniref:salicylate hydroxylase n=1 Tax=Boeremia exigua TaxID=749465 RepID=UPI001E8E8C02|nr:salicylate hydroxylase [Boeremia exigua]KAH6642750.1 salicylate hydroxylase [Boeremia exigua]
MPLELDIVVVGAGMAGLATAISLRKSGHKVTVLEQAAEFGEIGAGVQVPPNAARELIRWGLEDEMERIASKPGLLNYRNWKTGEARGISELSTHRARFGAPYWQVYRPDYHSILLKAALKAGATLRPGCTVTAYEPEQGTVVLESGERVVGDLVVACDGVKSIARAAMGQDVEPHETGDTCFRAVIPGEVLRRDPELASLVTTPGFEQWLGPDHHIIGYNMQKEATYNLLMVIPDDNTMVGYKAPASASEVRTAFAGWNPVCTKLLTLVPPDLERWRLIDLKPVSKWLHPSSRLLLIGDAVHATLPYLAQGAAMAIEDASALGFCLSSTRTRSRADIAPALRFFHDLRRGRAHAIQRGSWANRFFIHMRDGPQWEMREEVFRAGDYPGSPNLMADSLFQEWLYGYDVVRDAGERWEGRAGGSARL